MLTMHLCKYVHKFRKKWPVTIYILSILFIYILLLCSLKETDLFQDFWKIFLKFRILKNRTILNLGWAFSLCWYFVPHSFKLVMLSMYLKWEEPTKFQQMDTSFFFAGNWFLPKMTVLQLFWNISPRVNNLLHL